MTIRQPRYPLEEFAQRGDEIYDRDIRAQVEPAHNDEIVAIDIETGAWELDRDANVAADRLEARLPDAQTWVVRVDSRYVRRFGAGRSGQMIVMEADRTPSNRIISPHLVQPHQAADFVIEVERG